MFRLFNRILYSEIGFLMFFSSSTAMEDDATARLTEATDMALGGSDETPTKDNAKLEVVDQSQQALQQPHCGGG